LTLLAWATSQPIENLNMAVVDLDKSEQSIALVQQLDSTDEIDYKRDFDSIEEAYDAMDKVTTIFNLDDKTIVSIVIPENYGEDLIAGNRPTVQVILNGAESIGSLTADRATQLAILEQAMRDRFNMEPEEYADQLPDITVKYNEDLKPAWYTLPAEMGLMFYMMTIAIAALAITREKEMGTYEQLLVMPFRPIEVILGKALTPMMVGYMLFLSMLLLTVSVFGVPLRGSFPLLLVLAVVYLLAEMGKGVLLSMSSKTQMQAFMLVFVVAMVDMVFSGYAVAVETMPPLMQQLSMFIPIRHWLIIMRGIMLKNAGLDVLWPNVLALILIGSVIMSFTAIQYRRNVG
jgi:ABC-2 type transport system permease protein